MKGTEREEGAESPTQEGREEGGCGGRKSAGPERRGTSRGLSQIIALFQRSPGMEILV